MSILTEEYYSDTNVLRISKGLLGKVLFTCVDEVVCAGIIVETEAYSGISDKANHAYGNKRTRRTENMFHKGGIAYVYLCYGIHPLFNIVSGKEEIPDAVLIRAIEPLTGLDEMRKRRGFISNHFDFNGPGKVSKAMGITLVNNGIKLTGETIWLEDRGIDVPHEEILITPRIGVDYAGEDALLPYRFVWKKL